MQLTNALASFILLAAAGVQAAPGTPVQERQATPTVSAQVFSQGGCQGPPLASTVFVENTNCVNITIPVNYGSAFFSGNTLTRAMRFYDVPGCPETGAVHYYDLPAGPVQGEGCRAQHIGSVRSL